MKPTTLMDLMYAVTHDDRFDNVMLSSDVLQVLEIAALKIGLSSLGAPTRLDLGNGEVLRICVEGKTPEPMKFSVQELRPEVLAFALMMEQRLREKDADRGQGWKEADIDNLRVCATAKVYQIENATHLGAHHAAAGAAVDLANYCMMIADVAGALDEAVEIINGEPQH